MNGLYSIILRTPLGAKKGTFAARSAGNVLTGTLTFKDRSEEVKEGRLDGNKFTFSGSLMSPRGVIDYQAQGSFDEQGLSGDLETNKGTFTFKGTKK